MATQVITLEGIAKAGVIKDTPPVMLPPGAWTDARNVRFKDGAIRRMKGEIDILQGHGLDNIQHIAYWENPNLRCWVVVNRETSEDVVYIVAPDSVGGGVVSDKGSFSYSDNWNSCQFNGGYSFIINNGIQAPQHMTVQIGGSATPAGQPDLAPLPNWDSYVVNEYPSDEVNVSAQIIIPFGNLLIAGALQERGKPVGPVISDLSFVVDADDADRRNVSLTFANTYVPVAGEILRLTGNANYTYTWTKRGDDTLIDPDQEISYTVPSPYNRYYQFLTGTLWTPVDYDGSDFTVSNVFDDDQDTGLEVAEQPFGDESTPAEWFIANASGFPPYVDTADAVTFQIQIGGADVNNVVIRDLNGVVRASSVAAPGAIPQNWNPFASGAGTADELNIANTGQITAVKELRGNVFVYTSDTITQLRVSSTGLAAVPITNEYGAVTQSGVVSFQGTHLIVGSDDIYIFAGNPGDIKSIADGRMRQYFIDNLSPINFRDMQWVRNQAHDEMWLCYPTTNSVYKDEALIWNYTNNTWTIRDLDSIRHLATGPIPGGGGGVASRIVFTGDDAIGLDVDITVINEIDQRTTVNRTANTVEILAEAVTLYLNEQAGFAAEQDENTIYVYHLPISNTRWNFELAVNEAEITYVITPDVEVPVTIDTERPWPVGVLNEAKNFIVGTTSDPDDAESTLRAFELGYDINGSNEAFVERKAMRFSPEKDTEHLHAVFMHTMGNTNLNVDVEEHETAGQVDAGRIHNYSFQTQDDYKLDTRLNSRFIDIKVANNNDDVDWTIAGIELEVGKGGTR